MSMPDLQTASNIATIYQVAAPIIIGGASGLLGGTAYVKFFRKKERRLISNWKRPIAIIPSPNNTMESESALLKKAAFFDNIDLLAADGRSVDQVSDKHRLVIMRYEQDSPYFWDVYDRLRTKQTPVIIYAEQGAISREDFTRIQQYLYHTVCNTPVRLLSDVAAIMGTYPSKDEER